jgi:hypothetical protein
MAMEVHSRTQQRMVGAVDRRRSLFHHDKGGAMKRGIMLGLVLAACCAFAAGQAAADPSSVAICPSAGTALSGNYTSLTVTGNAYVAGGATLTVSGDLTIAPGACLDAFSLGTVRVGGNIFVGHGAILGLGCTPFSLGDPTIPPCYAHTTNDTVGGSIVAYNPLTMYLDGDTIHGNVFSIGGGPGLHTHQFVNFPIKDNRIGGNLIVENWQGGWFGAIRNNVGGSALFASNMSVLDPDANEIQTNTIAGSLLCFNNSPAAQVNPADGGQPNVVGGQKVGQCAGL